jgi:hypothetical protein
MEDADVMREYEMSQATIEIISSQLGPDMPATHRRAESWEDCLKAAEVLCAEAQQALGELRDPLDWQSLPKDKSVRVVYLVDELGPVIRWLLPEAPEVRAVLGGIFHDDLERGEGGGRARSGWLKVLEKSVRVE